MLRGLAAIAEDLFLLVPGPLVDLGFSEAGLAREASYLVFCPLHPTVKLVDQQLYLALVLAKPALLLP